MFSFMQWFLKFPPTTHNSMISEKKKKKKKKKKMPPKIGKNLKKISNSNKELFNVYFIYG